MSSGSEGRTHVTRGHRSEVRALELPGELPAEGPIVSVLIPSRNSQRSILGCLSSVLLQSYRSVEVVVCDDCSTDRTPDLIAQVAKSDDRVTVTCNTKPEGTSETIMRMLEMTSGPFVKILSPCDQFCAGDALAYLVSAIGTDENISIVTGYSGLIDEQGTPTGIAIHRSGRFPENAVVPGRQFGDHLLCTLADRFAIDRTGVLFRKDALPPGEWETVGGVAPGPCIAGDLIWWLNLLSRGDIALVDRMLTQIRLTVTSAAGRPTVETSPNQHWLTGSPLLWPEALKRLHEGARRIGYLADPPANRRALIAILQRVGEAFLWAVGFNRDLPEIEPAMFPGGGADEWASWSEGIKGAIREISSLTFEIHEDREGLVPSSSSGRS